MRIVIRSSVQFVFMVLTVSLLSGQVRQPNPVDKPTASLGIAAKKPVFAGACKACP